MKLAVSAFTKVFLLICLLGCINTSYSRKDEINICNDLAHLILGQFAHHGTAFYEHEVIRNNKLLEDKKDDFEARNDLGAAYLKLGKWDAAEKEIKENERLYPGRYKTASNLGVLYKKMGRYQEAGESIKQALQIKAGGHMGLGDYYLKMINWLELRDSLPKDKLPENDFIGVPFTAETQAHAEAADRDFVITLIKNDYQFGAVYFLLGDILQQEGKLQLALRAYNRSAYLDRAFTDIADSRIESLRDYWRSSKERGYIVERRSYYSNQLDDELNNAENWLASFQTLEAARLKQDLPVAFEHTLPALKALGISKPHIYDAIYYKGEETTRGGLST
ncbi:MAG: tetratricopeptide repeat protein, partial [Lentisphaeraceae bacterium]|nr:tetratricopeptide repeat protein [Lentisphaeraceae bacterium]